MVNNHIFQMCMYLFAEPLGEKCCQVMCYEKEDCKLAYSPQCTDLPVQCAMGKSGNYTVYIELCLLNKGSQWPTG